MTCFRALRPFTLLLGLCALAVVAHGLPPGASGEQLTVQFGDVVQLTFPKHWHYVDPDRPERMVRRGDTVRTSFSLPATIPASGLALFEARSQLARSNSELRLDLSISSRTRHPRAELEAALRAPSERAHRAILEDPLNMPGVMRASPFVKDLVVLEARVVPRGTLLCESYAIHYRIDTQLYEAHHLVCPLERGSLLLMLENGAPQPGRLDPMLAAISSSVTP